MKLKTLYVRFYKSFNFDYLRKSHPDAEGQPWDYLAEDQQKFYPFVRVRLEAGITTVVGANESGKSQLLSAIKYLLEGEGIEQRDFCRYSEFFSVNKEMRLPEFGGEFHSLSDAEQTALRQIFDLQDDVAFDSFHLFRTNAGVALYVPNESSPDGWRTEQLKSDDVKKLNLPTYFLIDAKTPLPDSVPISYLASTAKKRIARPRKKVFGWLEAMFDNPSWFESKESLDKNSQELLAGHASINTNNESDDEHFFKRLDLAEKLLIEVAGIGTEAFDQLRKAVKSHDGYANAIVAKMNDELASALNFPKWWSQDGDFRLSLTLRDFDLVFTVCDSTGSEYAFSERSGGMSYFLSYFVQYLSHRPAGGQEVLLMDEPDAYLSMLGQQDLLRIFDAFARPEDAEVAPIQVIYVTHSPFLIDKNHSERIRVLEKGAGDEGTRLVANAGRNHYEPLRSAFGAFVAETTFISNCNLMLEGQADQVLLAGLSSLARRRATTGETLDLNTLTMVPAGSAEHIPYMAYLARGRDVDTPAVVVLLDGDGEGDKIAAELERGYRDRKYVEKEFVLQTSQLDSSKLDLSTDSVREIEDLIPGELAVLAIHRFAAEVVSKAEAEAVAEVVTDLTIPPGEKLYKAAQQVCAGLTPPLRLDKVGFARAVVSALEDDADESLCTRTFQNFEQLFIQISAAQSDAMRKNDREKVSRTISRFKRAFLRDHPTAASRREVTALLADITSQLTEVTDETEAVRSAMRLLGKDFELATEPGALISDYESLKERLGALTYQGIRDVQA